MDETLAVADAPRPRSGRSRRGIADVVAWLTLANVIGAASGFISGPLLARALGAAGRGDLAAIIVPLSLAPAILGLGIPAFAYLEIPRGRPPGEVICSLGAPLLLLGGISIAIAVPVADMLAGGRSAVRLMLVIGLMSMPLALLANLLADVLGGLQRWRSVFVVSLTPFVVNFAGIVTLYLLGGLTVTTAAICAIAGSLLAILPGLPLLRTRLVFRAAVTRAGVSWGARSWLGGLAQLTNARLDQFLMITVVAPRELGLYAVAVTIASASGLVTKAIAPPLMARIAGGETSLMSQAVRIMLSATVAVNLVLVLVAPVLLSVLFGPQFTDAYPMTVILFAAQVPFVGAQVLSTALQADGAPLIPTIAEAIAVVITVAGLLVLLRPLGGIGAAIVSVVAYSASFIFQIVMAHRRTGIAVRRFLIPSRDDAAWARGRAAAILAALPGRAAT